MLSAAEDPEASSCERVLAATGPLAVAAAIGGTVPQVPTLPTALTLSRLTDDLPVWSVTVSWKV